MLTPELPPEHALSLLRARERITADTRLTAAQLCIEIAMRSNHDGLYSRVLDYFGIPAPDGVIRPPQGFRNIGFWLGNTKSLRFTNELVLPPRVLVVETRDRDISFTFHRKTGGRAVRLDLGLFNDPPQWWLDFGATGARLADNLEVNADAAEVSREYTVGTETGLITLQAAGGVILTALAEASWEEALVLGNGEMP